MAQHPIKANSSSPEDALVCIRQMPLVLKQANVLR
jgi:hypothetical protein